jgi:hypothetical protein
MRPISPGRDHHGHQDLYCPVPPHDSLQPGFAFFFLVRDKGDGDRTVKRLTWRIGLSLVLFLLLWGAYQLGWIEPSSGGPVRFQKATPEDDQTVRQ